MEVDSDLLARIKPLADIGDERVHACAKINKRNKTQGGRACMLVTEFEFILLEKSGKNSDFSVTHRATLDQISKLNILSEHSFGITYPNNVIELESKSTQFIVAELAYLVKERNIGRFEVLGDTSRIRFKEISPLAFINRMKLYAFKTKIKLPSNIVSAILNIVRQEKPTLNLSQIRGSEKFLHYILPAVGGCKTITEIIIPSNGVEAYWKIMGDFVEYNYSVQSIGFTAEITEDFKYVIQAFQKNKQTKIKELSFINSALTTTTAPFFLHLFDVRTFNAITFGNAFEQTSISQVLRMLGESNEFQNIFKVTVKDTPFLPADQFMAALKQANDVTIENCQADLGKILPYLKSSTLNCITVDGGFSNGSGLNGDQIFGPQLTTIHFPRIRWEGNSFIFLWCSLLKHAQGRNGLSIDLSKVQVGAQVWQHFFTTYCVGATPAIQEFKWDGNQVQAPLVQFLNQCEMLTKLSLNGCFGPQYVRQFQFFCQYVAATKRLQELSLKGADGPRLEGMAQGLFQALLNNTSLRVLDVSGQGLGDAGVGLLGQLLSINRALEHVIFDDSGVTSPDTLAACFKGALARGSAIDIGWPFADVARLRTQGGFPRQAIDALRRRQVMARQGRDAEAALSPIEEEPEEACADGGPSLEALCQGPIWKLDLPDVPAPDNAQLLKNAAHVFSVEQLVAQMTSQR